MLKVGKQKHMIIMYLLIFFYCLNSVTLGVGPNEVIIWGEAGFSGESRSLVLDPGMRQRLDSNTRWEPLKSMELGSNVSVAVYRRYSFEGPYKIFEDSVGYVGDYWNGAIWSIIIFPKNQTTPLGVTLSDTAPNTVSGYEPTSEFFPLPEDLNETEALYRAFPRNIDENAKYVIIQGDNVEAELFQGHNFEPTDFSLKLPAKTKVCSDDAEGEFNGRKFYRLSGCVLKNAASMKVRWIGPKERSPTQGTPVGGFIQEPVINKTSPLTTAPNGGVARTVGISWQQNKEVIQVIFNQFPAESWSHQWEMYIDNKKMPVEAPQGSPNVRPNAELDKHPTGVFIGALPWPSSLTATDFPCCGTMKFCIPDRGCTNEVEFNLLKEGCKTMSPKNCSSGAQPPTAGNDSWSITKLEENTDRPGMNYKSYYLPSADTQLCANDCANDPNCKAFTYVKPGVRGANSAPECWLKNVAPNPMSSECCVSGAK